MFRRLPLGSRILSSRTSCSPRFISGTPPRTKSAGYGNVTDRNLPSTFDTQIYSSDGAPKTPDFTKHLAQPRVVSILPCPQTYGQPYIGTDRGPDLLLARGLATSLSGLGWRVESTSGVSSGPQSVGASSGSSSVSPPPP
eukprot:CAMPEP_0182482944 /NCGR_PEP_ID=MMETSP1319-20130603/40255_1 /TAXON_ID=172717 /ORGANISM="Bolidomonas pacifica, Strain RCC208" /LENGTH=139 /DNA_ID=CAMNT_0024684697 /DNA_START=91 /DNA_END=506 /DNA_ORIENTATION=+